jgi:hypothetical protein
MQRRRDLIRKQLHLQQSNEIILLQDGAMEKIGTNCQLYIAAIAVLVMMTVSPSMSFAVGLVDQGTFIAAAPLSLKRPSPMKNSPVLCLVPLNAYSRGGLIEGTYKNYFFQNQLDTLQY